MSDDGGSDLEQRVARLEEQNRQLAAQLARYLPDGPSRRDVLKYGATAFAAAGVGSGLTGAAIADGHNDNDGQVGTEANPVDVLGEYVQANSVRTNTESITPIDSVAAPARDTSLRIVGTNVGTGVILQAQQDTGTDGDERANIYWYTAQQDPQERLATMQASAPNNEWSLYTKTDAIGSGDTGLEKRVNIPGDRENTRIELVNSLSDTILKLAAATGSNAEITFGNNSVGNAFEIRWNGSVDTFQFVDFINNTVAYQYIPGSRSMDWEGTTQKGLREISNPTAGDLLSQEWAWDATNSRWLYKDSGGTAHYFTPDGNL